MKKDRANHFKLSPRGVMLAMVSAALSQAALANTGHVDFAIGNIVVAEPGGRAHPLVKGAEVGSGDRITSGADGRAQIRFSDGAYMSIQPNTEFDINQYRFDGKADGTESALFGLLKGALRAVTGLVGRINHSKFQITTPTATIGIRGTGGLIQVNNDGSTLVVGSSGIWSLTNLGGSLDVPAGTAGFAGTNRNAPPQRTSEGPVVPPPQPTASPLPPFIAGDIVGPAGNSFIPATGPGYVVASNAGNSPLATAPNAVFDSTGQLIQFTGTVLSCGIQVACFNVPATFTLAGTQMEASNDGFLSWGRWTGDILVNGVLATLTPNQGIHYVTGIPTPAASMPTSGTFTYNLIGATSPTLADGSVAPGVLNSASLTGDFTRNAVNVNLSATAGGSTFTGSAAGSITSSTFTALGSASASGPGPIGCSGSCTVNVNGFFTGAGASHAGILYEIGTFNQSTATSSTLSGAAALAR